MYNKTRERSRQIAGYKFKSGKHKGKTIWYVYLNDKAYLQQMLVEQWNSPFCVELSRMITFSDDFMRTHSIENVELDTAVIKCNHRNGNTVLRDGDEVEIVCDTCGHTMATRKVLAHANKS